MRLERRCGDYVISDDPARFDADAMHDFLEVEGYWAAGRQREQTAAAAANSVVLGVYGPDGSMVGGARIVTDRATFGWLTDVYVLAEHRGLGLGRAVVAAACEHPAVAAVKRLLLRTADAHELYRSFGFTEPPAPERWMELRREPGGPASLAGAAGAGLAGTGGTSLAGTAGAGLAGTGGTSLAGAGGTSLAGTAETSLAGTGGTSLAGTAGASPAGAAGGAGGGSREPSAGGDGASSAAFDPAAGPRPHSAWQGSGLPDPRTAPVSQIATRLLEIVTAEGPVTADRAYRLYIRGAGSSKVTQRARTPMEQALGRLRLRGQVEVDELDNAGEMQQVLRLSGTPAVAVRELGERSLYEAPLNEIAELMGHKRRELMGRAGGDDQPAHAVADVIRQAALRRASPERVKRAVLDAYGLIRMTQAAEQYLDAALALLDEGAA